MMCVCVCGCVRGWGGGGGSGGAVTFQVPCYKFGRHLVACIGMCPACKAAEHRPDTHVISLQAWMQVWTHGEPGAEGD